MDSRIRDNDDGQNDYVIGETHSVIPRKSKLNWLVIMATSLLVSVILEVCAEFLSLQYRNSSDISALTLIAIAVCIVFGVFLIASAIGFGLSDPFEEKHIKRYKTFATCAGICFISLLLMAGEGVVYPCFFPYYDAYLKHNYNRDMGITEDYFITKFNLTQSSGYMVNGADPDINCSLLEEYQTRAGGQNDYRGTCYNIGDTLILETIVNPSSDKIIAMRLKGNYFAGNSIDALQMEQFSLQIKSAFVQVNQALDSSNDPGVGTKTSDGLFTGMKGLFNPQELSGRAVTCSGNGYIYQLQLEPVDAPDKTKLTAVYTIKRDTSDIWWNEYKRKTWPLLF